MFILLVYCLNCDGISNPNQCQQITVCGNGSVSIQYLIVIRAYDDIGCRRHIALRRN